MIFADVLTFSHHIVASLKNRLPARVLTQPGDKRLDALLDALSERVRRKRNERNWWFIHRLVLTRSLKNRLEEEGYDSLVVAVATRRLASKWSTKN